MESKECLEGNVEVLATGGYAGNVLMKSIEGTAMLVTNILRINFVASGLVKYPFSSTFVIISFVY